MRGISTLKLVKGEEEWEKEMTCPLGDWEKERERCPLGERDVLWEI